MVAANGLVMCLYTSGLAGGPERFSGGLKYHYRDRPQHSASESDASEHAVSAVPTLSLFILRQDSPDQPVCSLVS